MQDVNFLIALFTCVLRVTAKHRFVMLLLIVVVFDVCLDFLAMMSSVILFH